MARHLRSALVVRPRRTHGAIDAACPRYSRHNSALGYTSLLVALAPAPIAFSPSIRRAAAIQPSPSRALRRAFLVPLPFRASPLGYLRSSSRSRRYLSRPLSPAAAAAAKLRVSLTAARTNDSGIDERVCPFDVASHIYRYAVQTAPPYDTRAQVHPGKKKFEQGP